VKKDTLTYEIDNNLYINLTNRCSNNCEFCVRNHLDSYDGYDLWLEREPTVDEIISELKTRDIEKYNEIVFCGYGEPTYRYDVIKDVADYVHAFGAKTRVNTNGQGNRINGKDITADIYKYLDKINVSLNASNAKKYDADCHSEYGEEAFFDMLDFAKKCKEAGANVIFSVVDCIGEDEIKACKHLADSYGIPLRIREMI